MSMLVASGSGTSSDSDIAFLSPLSLSSVSLEDAASLVVSEVNKLVLNSTSLNSTPGIGTGEPLFYGTLAHIKNRTSTFNDVIENYHLMYRISLGVKKLFSAPQLLLGESAEMISEIARQAIYTECGDCQEMSYVGGLFLRNNGFQGRIKFMIYGPAEDKDSVLIIEGQTIVADQHIFLLLEADKEEPWVADIWAKKHFPFSMWRDELKGCGSRCVDLNKCYGVLIDSSDMPREVPRLVTDFTALFPSMPQVQM